ncbi:site-specific integrase [bacterium]|nr:site-specific integrase [bacterium]
MQNKDKLSIDDGLHVYFENTKSRKTANTYYSDLSIINQSFEFFKDRGYECFEEIKPLDILNLISQLDEAGKAEPTIKNAVTAVRKVYNFLIDEADLLSGMNPVPRKVKLPKKNGLVRDRLASDEEINKLLKAIQKDELSKRQSNLPTSSISPLGNILQFLIFTGARRSEVLHAEWSDFDLIEGIWKIRIKPTEWSDFDLIEGIWKIRIKPKCPTINGLGWYPKWKKPRDVILFPEALNLLRSIEKVETIGKVGIRDQNHKIVGHKIYPAQFVFPKKEFLTQDDGKVLTRYSRVDSIETGWRSLLKRAGVEDLQIKDLRT